MRYGFLSGQHKVCQQEMFSPAASRPWLVGSCHETYLQVRTPRTDHQCCASCVSFPQPLWPARRLAGQQGGAYRHTEAPAAGSRFRFRNLLECELNGAERSTCVIVGKGCIFGRACVVRVFVEITANMVVLLARIVATPIIMMRRFFCLRPAVLHTIVLQGVLHTKQKTNVHTTFG